MLRDLDARDVRFDGFELAAVFGVRIRLGIPAIHLADAAAKQQVDDRNIALGGRGRLRAQPQNISIAHESEQAQRSDLQKCAAIKVFVHKNLNG